MLGKNPGYITNRGDIRTSKTSEHSKERNLRTEKAY